MSARIVTPPRVFAALATLAILGTTTPAHAHLMNTGFGPFYDGLTHLFVTPEDLLPVLALTLLAGLRGPRFGRTVVFVLPLAWLGASLASSLLAPPITASAATAVLTIALGAMAAADQPLPLLPLTAFAVLLGLVNGGSNGAELARAPQSGLAAAGVACALFVLVSLLAGHVASVRAPWARVAARVAGSWIAAIGLLMLGWSLRA